MSKAIPLLGLFWFIANAAPGSIIYSNGFNESAAPSGWAVVRNPGENANLFFVSSGVNPTCAPEEGARMVEFNAYDSDSGEEVRLLMTNPVPLSGMSALALDFAWHRDSQYPSYVDTITARWSTNGAAWTDLGTVERYSGEISGWMRPRFDLPPAALAGGALYIGFLFHSGWGNNCHFDNVRLIGPDAGIVSVTPAVGPVAGGNSVTIAGIQLGNGADITNVTLCGVAGAIQSQSATQVVVQAGAAGGPALGDVRVQSASSGTLVATNAYRYADPLLQVLNAAGGLVTNGADAATAHGTDFGNVPVGVSTPAPLTLTNSGAALTISGISTNGTGAAAFSIQGVPTHLPALSGQSFEIRFAPPTLGVWTAAVSLVNSSTNTPYWINVRGGGYGITTNNGPATGGNELTLYGLDFGGAVTGVTLCGVAAEILAQTATSVTVRAAGGGAGAGAAVIQRAGDEIVIARAYTYNPAGLIFGAPGWTAISNLPQPFGYMGIAVVSGVIYSVGGYTGDTSTNLFLRYDPAQPEAGWTALTNLPAPLSDQRAAAVGSRIYSIGGYDPDDNYTNGVWFYDTANPAAGWQTGPRLPEPRGDHGVAVVDGRIYAVAGYVDYFTQLDSVLAFDPARPEAGWTAVSNLPEAVGGNDAAAVGQHLYSIGGTPWTSNAWRYTVNEPQAGWTALSNLPAGFWYAPAVTLSERVYALGSTDGSRDLANTWFIRDAHPEDGWQSGPELPCALGGHGAAVVAGQAFLIGGWSNHAAYSEQCYAGYLRAGVYPDVGPLAGSNLVTIAGLDLGNGGDITNVMLAGIPAVILAQEGGEILVRAGAAGAPTSGAVVVQSLSHGTTIRADAYAYCLPGFRLLGTNRVEMTNGEPASLALGTDFATLFLGDTPVHTLTITNSQAPVVISGVTTDGAGAAAFQLTAPGQVNFDEAAPLTIRFAPPAPGLFTARVTITHSASNSPFVFDIAGRAIALSATNGPAAGGNVIVLTGADLDSVTNLLLCGQPAAIISQSATQLVLIAAPGGAGTGAVEVQSSAWGTLVFSGRYTYNPPGAIFGQLVGWTRFATNLPTVLGNHAAVVTGNRLFVVGGNSGSIISMVRWLDLTNVAAGWQTATALPAPRENLRAVAASGGLYAAGGYYSTSARGEVYRLALTNVGGSWTSVSNLPVRYGCGLAGMDTRLYAYGGYGTAARWDCLAYDILHPERGWSNSVYLPVGLYFMGAAALDSRLFSLGGIENGAASNRALAFDTCAPAAGWIALSNLPVRAARGMAAALHDELYFIGGEDNLYNELGTVYRYRPDLPAAGWGVASNLPVLRRDAAAVTWNDNIYIIGGHDGTNYVNTIWQSVHWPGVLPDIGPITGGYPVAIGGWHLGDGADITNVTLAGIPVQGILSQSSTQVVVLAGAVEVETTGAVVVQSTHYGVTIKPDAFTYARPQLNARGTNGAELAHDAAPSLEAGTDFGGRPVGAWETRLFALTNSGADVVISGVSTDGAGATAFAVSPLPSGLAARSGTGFSITFNPPAAGVFTAALVLANSSSNNPYVIHLRGLGAVASTNRGPADGGNLLTYSGPELGNGSDITNVTLCGFAAEIVSQTATSVTVRAGAGEWRSGDVVIESASGGRLILYQAYAYRPKGYIFGSLQGWTALTNLPLALQGHCGAAVSGRLYCVGGYGASQGRREVYSYDPAQPSLGWQAGTNLPDARYSQAGAAVGGRLCVAGGRLYSAYYADAWQLGADPATNWLTLPSLPEYRAYGAGAALDDRWFYMLSGLNNGGYSTTAVIRLDLLNTNLGWQTAPNLPVALPYLAAAQLYGRVFALGGGSTNLVLALDARRPDLGWQAYSNLPLTQLNYPAAAAINGRIYVLGGYDYGAATSAVWSLDIAAPAANWRREPVNLPVSVYQHAAVALDNQLYWFGGVGGTALGTEFYRAAFGSGITPETGPLSGGNTVTITGSHLTDGDVTNVTLCGIAATVVSQNETQVVVTAGASGSPGAGDVRVYSVSRGETVKSNAYTYTPPELRVLGTNGATIVNDDPPALAPGTDYGGLLSDASLTHVFRLTNSGSALAISGVTTSGPHAAAFRVVSWPAVVDGLSASSLVVRFQPAAVGVHTARLTIANNSTNAPFQLNVTGRGFVLSTNNGPQAGGDLLTIIGVDLTDGSPADVTNVTLCGVAAEVISQSATQLVVRAGPGGVETGAIVIQTVSRGELVFANGYTYNPRGWLFGRLLDWSTNIVVSLPKRTRYAAGATIGNRLYVAGGAVDGMTTNAVYLYDLTNAAAGWQLLAPLPSNRMALGLAAAGRHLAAFGGVDSFSYNSRAQAWIFDTENPAGGWTAISNLPIAGYSMAAAGSGGRAYCFGGNTTNVYSTDPTRPEQGWRLETTLPNPNYLREAGCAVDRGRIYLVGGYDGTGYLRLTRVWNALNPAAGWITTSNLPYTVSGGRAMPLNGRIYYVGYSFSGQYDPQRPDLGWGEETNIYPYQVTEFVGLAAGDRLYVIGGYDQNYRSNVAVGVFATGVSPAYDAVSGGATVTLAGAYLGNGGDITNVTLAGIPVQSIVRQFATQVVVIAGAAPAPTAGAACVWSTSHGFTERAEAFTYIYPQFTIFAANRTELTNGAPANREQGTDFGGRTIGSTSIAAFMLTNGNAALPLNGYTLEGAGAAMFGVSGALSNNLPPYTSTTFQISYTPTVIGVHTAALLIAHGSTGAPYRIYLRGEAYWFSTNNGPAAGGYIVTISGVALGDGTNLTNVSVCGIAATIVTQSAGSATVQLGASGEGRAGDVVFQFNGAEEQRVLSAWRYNAPGYLYGPFLGWTPIATLPRARAYTAAAAWGDRILSIGGYAPGDRQSNVYELVTTNLAGGWREVRPLPGRLYDHAAAAAAGQAWVSAGFDYDFGDEVTNVRVRAMTTPDGVWTETRGLPCTLQTHACVVWSNWLYVLGGATNSESSAEVWLLDTTNPAAGWMAVSNLPAPRQSLAAAVAGDRIYAIAGYGNSPTSSVFEYRPGQPNAGWTVVADLPAPRFGLTAAAMNERLVLALGGYQYAGSRRAEMYAYDPLDRVSGWRQIGTTPTNVGYAALARVGNDLYHIGGYMLYYTNGVWQGRFGPGVAPTAGELAGGYPVILSGDHLGAGDVTNITLAGVPVQSIISQNATQIVVVAGAAGAPGPGDVVVESPSHGRTILSNGFAYASAATYRLIAGAGPNGNVAPAETNVSGGQDAVFTLTPAAYYHLAAVLTNGGPAGGGWGAGVVVYVWSNVTATGALWATFAENLTPIYRVPEFWLARYGWTNEFGSAETNDADGDRVLTWREYYADTDPTNAQSYFSITQLLYNAAATINIPCSTTRIYSLERTADIAREPWSGVAGQTNIPGAPAGTLLLMDTNGGHARGYRVDVRLP